MFSLRILIRQLLREPGYTAVVLLTLALGIGVNTAIFSVVDRLLTRPLPVPNPEQLALVGQPASGGRIDWEFNYPLFRDYQRENAVFAELSAVAPLAVGLGHDARTLRHRALLVSGNYFTMLGVVPALGRTFAEDEGREPDDAAVVVLSHGLWQGRFGADPGVVGKPVTINGRSFEVIGVTPREFTGTTRGPAPELYLPITVMGQVSSIRPGGDHPLATRYFIWHQVLGRLRPGVTHEQAQASLRTLAARLHEVTPSNTDTNVAVLPGRRGFEGEAAASRLPLILLWSTALLVLLVACANLGNLQLARASARAGDFAVRLALGADRRQLIRSLLAESLVLALAGGLLGVLVAVGLTRLLVAYLPAAAGMDAGGLPDLRLLAFALGTAVVTGLLFGLAPARRAGRMSVVPELKGRLASAEARAGRLPVSQTLVVAQIAFSLVVLVAAGLCIRSLARLHQVDAGFEPSRVLVASFDLELNRYDAPRAGEFYEQLLERVRTLPGVESASLGTTVPLGGLTPGTSISRIEGHVPTGGRRPSADFNVVAPGYFRTLRTPVLRGREFDASDTAGGRRVAIIDEALAREYLPGLDPIGRHLELPGDDAGKPIEIVGVVGSIRHRQLTELPRRTVYFPAAQRPSLGFHLVIRTAGTPESLAEQVRQLARALDPAVPMFQVRTLEQQRAGSISHQRMTGVLLSAFSALSLLLASLGLYGVLSYAVSRRTREIGIRMAVGAQSSDVLRMILRRGAVLAVGGIAWGIAGALAAARGAAAFLYEISPFDPATFGVGVAVMLGVSLAACWIPARRATRVSPVLALRSE